MTLYKLTLHVSDLAKRYSEVLEKMAAILVIHHYLITDRVTCIFTPITVRRSDSLVAHKQTRECDNGRDGENNIGCIVILLDEIIHNLINQSIDQSINQSINQAIKQSSNQAIKQSELHDWGLV